MPLKAFKTFLLTHCPEALLLPIKKWRHLQTVKTIDERDEPELAVVRRLVQQGDLVCDVGANIGVYSVQLNKAVGDSGRILAFEPVPITFDVLNHNIKSLGLRNIATYNLAVSDSSGTVQMEIPEYSAGGKNYYQAHIATNPTASTAGVSIRSEKLDLLLAGERSPSFIKIDVEGAELSVIRGAENTISSHRPAMMIEIASDIHKSGTDGHEIYEIMSKLGYSVLVLIEGKLKAHAAGMRGLNYFFLQSKHLERVRDLN